MIIKVDVIPLSIRSVKTILETGKYDGVDVIIPDPAIMTDSPGYLIKTGRVYILLPVNIVVREDDE